jgi:hypothetical protein
VGLTGDTGYFWFFQSTNVELRRPEPAGDDAFIKEGSPKSRRSPR